MDKTCIYISIQIYNYLILLFDGDSYYLYDLHLQFDHEFQINIWTFQYN